MARAAFFLGSGISRASGCPTVNEITASLLKGPWKRHTDGRFLPCRPDEGKLSLGAARQAQDFLRLLKKQIDPHLRVRERRAGNYEDIYAVALQIVQDETREITNPLISRSLAAIKKASRRLHVGKEHHIDRNSFASLADRACDLVQWTVYHGLSRAKTPIGMEAIAAVARLTDAVDIFTVNHDTLVKLQLARSGIPFCDGFGKKTGDVRIYGASWSGRRVRVLKLHGSTKWYLFRFPEWDQFASVESNQGYAKDQRGQLLDDLDVKPLFLTGTTVKEQAYGIGLFGEIFGKFRELLSTHRTLICCGYGWGDKGINIRLSQWLRNARENRIVVLHGGIEDELARKRFWHWRWSEYVAAGKVVVVRKWLADCTAKDLQPFFDD
jgi:hypothetical protein